LTRVDAEVQMSGSTMQAFVLTGPGEGSVREVPVPVAAPGEAVVEVERVGVCGTDVELFTGELAYLHSGHSSYPLRPGHEWCGRVVQVGDAVDAALVGRRVMGDTMLGDRNCRRCRRGRQHVCEHRQEVGIRGGRHGALAERLAVPACSLRELPDPSTRSSARWSSRAATRGARPPPRGSGPATVPSSSAPGRSGC
jgi:threonine dehydrogenase-like Zn-dependent dehydrogenase